MLDAGVFVALDKGDRFVTALFERVRLTRLLIVVASTVGEFWRKSTSLAAVRFGLLAPIILDVDLLLAKRAGELLASSGHDDLLDALVAAAAERLGAGRVYTSDPRDMEILLAHSDAVDCDVIAI